MQAIYGCYCGQFDHLRLYAIDTGRLSYVRPQNYEFWINKILHRKAVGWSTRCVLHSKWPQRIEMIFFLFLKVANAIRIQNLPPQWWKREKTKLKSKTTNDVVYTTWNKCYSIWSSWSESVRLIFNHLSEWHVGHRMARSFIKITFFVIDCCDMLLPVQPFARQLIVLIYAETEKTKKSNRLLLFIVADASECACACHT